MQQLLVDELTGDRVILAPARALRPDTFRVREENLPAREASCPFCDGNESETPPEVARIGPGAPETPGWRVRVVPNKFPALQIEGDLHKRGEGIYDMMNGVGAHEVIIDCPFHEVTITNLAEDNIREILWVYRDRLVDLKKDPRFVYGMLFKNVGAAAGASLEHSHSQLIVTPIVPINVWEEMTGALEFFNYRGRCIFCDIIHQEMAFEKRMVIDTPTTLRECSRR